MGNQEIKKLGRQTAAKAAADPAWDGGTGVIRLLGSKPAGKGLTAARLLEPAAADPVAYGRDAGGHVVGDV
jgi:hypothetical protein